MGSLANEKKERQNEETNTNCSCDGGSCGKRGHIQLEDNNNW